MDPLDRAIAAASAVPRPPAQYVPIEIELSRSGGRLVTLAVPLDLEPLELLELVAWLTAGSGGLADALVRTARGALVAATERDLANLPRT